MSTRTKSLLVLLATLLLGGVIGALLHARLVDQRIERLGALRSERGFTRFVEGAIEPADDQQRAAVRTVIDSTAARIGRHHSTSRAEMRAIIDTMKTRLAPVISEEQMRRLEERLERGGRRGRRWRDGPPPRERRDQRERGDRQEQRDQRTPPRDSAGQR